MKTEIQLSPEEKLTLQQGELLQDLTKHQGWQVIRRWLEDRAYHSWVDPRGLKRDEWEWAEINAYHSAEVAKQLLEDISSLVSQAEYLRKKERGDVEADKFKDFWKHLVK